MSKSSKSKSNNFENFIKKLDLFSIKISNQFNIGGKDVYATIYGGIISIFFGLIIIAYCYPKFYSLIIKYNPKLVY